MRRFWATNAHGPTNWMCNTGSVFEPSARKIFWGGKYAATSCGRIGRNGASGSATNENDPFWGGFGQAERAAEPPRGTGIGGGRTPEPQGGLASEALAKGAAACIAPRSAARFRTVNPATASGGFRLRPGPLWGQHYGGQA
jgi:hypothetical protein